MIESKPLLNRRILVVEDEYFIAENIRRVIQNAGGLVVGPFADLNDDDLGTAYTTVDVAVLDINIKGKVSFVLADKLRWRGVPFCFATGYDGDALPDRFAQSRLIMKPFDEPELVKELTQICDHGA